MNQKTSKLSLVIIRSIFRNNYYFLLLNGNRLIINDEFPLALQDKIQSIAVKRLHFWVFTIAFEPGRTHVGKLFFSIKAKAFNVSPIKFIAGSFGKLQHIIFSIIFLTFSSNGVLLGKVSINCSNNIVILFK